MNQVETIAKYLRNINESSMHFIKLNQPIASNIKFARTKFGPYKFNHCISGLKNIYNPITRVL